jgi:ferritin-like metal-binding protein YciE
MEAPMARTDDHLMHWLRDAHAMEQQAEMMLRMLADRIENYPEFSQRLDEHVQETRQQAQTVSDCIRRRGGDVSALKDTVGKTIGWGQGLSGFFAGDEIVKAALSAYTFKEMEIAAYAILIAAANAAGDRETAQACGGIIRQEEEMASFLRKSLPWVTTKFLGLEERPGATAKY